MSLKLINISTILLLIFAAGCRGGPRARSDNEFRVGIEGVPSTLDPRYASDAHGVRILPLIFRGLLSKKASGELALEMAESWETPDPLTHVLRLREGIKFHDGAILSARDVVANYKYVMNPENGSPWSGSLSALQSVGAPDDSTVVFKLSEMHVSFPFQLALGILPERLASLADLGDELVGTGPYKLASGRAGEEVILEAFPESFAGAPNLKRIKFRVVSNSTTMLLEMDSGGLDLLQNAVPPYSAKFLDRNPEVKATMAPGSSYQYLGFNLEDEILSDVRVRKAIAHAIDRDELISFAMAGLARQASGLLPPEHWAYEPNVVGYPYDLELSKKRLDEAGRPDPDGDGPEVRFTLSYKTSTDKTANEVAKIIASQLKKVGVGVEVRSFEWGTFFSDVKKGNFQIMSLRWIGLSDPDALHYIFHSESMPPNGANRGRYANKDVDAWLDASRREPNMEKRKELYSRVQKTLAEDCVYVSLWWMDNVLIMREDFEGYEPMPGGEYTGLAKIRRAPPKNDGKASF